MATEKKLVGHRFECKDIYSSDYTRVHMFPAGVSSSRPSSYYREDIERMESITARVSRYDIDDFPAGFEVCVVERRNGKVLNYSFLHSTPEYEEVEVEPAEEAK